MDDFSLVDAEAVVTLRAHAGRAADGAIDVGNGTTGTADDVVVVVTDPGLVSRHRARGLNVPHESGVAERPKSVVDGLVGDLAAVVPDGADVSWVSGATRASTAPKALSALSRPPEEIGKGPVSGLNVGTGSTDDSSACLSCIVVASGS